MRGEAKKELSDEEQNFMADNEKKNPDTNSETREIPEADKETNIAEQKVENEPEARQIQKVREKIKKEFKKNEIIPEDYQGTADKSDKKEADVSKVNLNYEKIPLLLEQLLADFKPAPERLKIGAEVKKIYKNNIELFCKQNEDNSAYNKLLIHELPEEPVQDILAICQKDGKKVEKKDFEKMLVELGYNVNVLFSKRDGCDYDAAINVNGYSIPGWNKVVDFLRKYNNNLAVFFGKRFAPGNSRLHVRMFEGNKHTYVAAHIDEFNWINTNVRGVKKSHGKSGQGDYVNGGKYFLKSLEQYLNKS